MQALRIFLRESIVHSVPFKCVQTHRFTDEWSLLEIWTLNRKASFNTCCIHPLLLNIKKNQSLLKQHRLQGRISKLNEGKFVDSYLTNICRRHVWVSCGHCRAWAPVRRAISTMIKRYCRIRMMIYIVETYRFSLNISSSQWSAVSYFVLTENALSNSI